MGSSVLRSGGPRRARGLLEDERRGRKAPERSWKGTLRQRVQVARGLPQVVVRITGHYQGHANVRARMLYVARNGEEFLRCEGGEEVVGRGEIEDLAGAWAADFSARKNARDATGFTVSLPPDLVRTPEERQRAEAAVAAFLEREMGGRFEYVFAAHTDRDHHHVHVIVKRRGRDGERLRTDPADLARWRGVFAEAAREQGFDVDASPRYARGKGRQFGSMAVDRIRTRGAEPEVDRGRRERGDAPVASERAVEVNAEERREFARVARETAEEASRIVASRERARGLELAGLLGVFAARMSGPEGAPEERPGWAEARVDVLATFLILRRESERLYGAEVAGVGRVGKQLAGAIERGERVDEREVLTLAREAAEGIEDPDRRRRATRTAERLADRVRARGIEPDEAER